VVDDGSTDDSAAVLAAFADRPNVRIVSHPGNRGQSVARNTGIDNLPAGTRYFGILDSDDTLLPDAVEVLVAVFTRSNDRFSQVFGWCQDMHTGEPTGTMVHRGGLLTYDDALAGRFDGEFWQLARMDLLGDMRFEVRARGGASGVWWRMLKDAPAWLVPNVVRNYDRSGTDRISLRGFSQRAAGPTKWAVKAMIEDPIGADMRARYPARYGGYLAELAKWAALAGDGAEARAAARAAVRISPSPRSLGMTLATMLPPAALRRFLVAKRGIAKRGQELLEGRDRPFKA
jgi:glycosyltransferase involved in cell wall biosynthesis